METITSDPINAGNPDPSQSPSNAANPDHISTSEDLTNKNKNVLLKPLQETDPGISDNPGFFSAAQSIINVGDHILLPQLPYFVDGRIAINYNNNVNAITAEGIDYQKSLNLHYAVTPETEEHENNVFILSNILIQKGEENYPTTNATTERNQNDNESQSNNTINKISNTDEDNDSETTINAISVSEEDNDSVTTSSVTKNLEEPNRVIQVIDRVAFLQCKSCSVLFISKEAIADHCSKECFKTIFCFTNTNQHFNLFYSKKIYQCEFCNYIFPEVELLLKHSASHIYQNRFECKECKIYMIDSYEKIAHHWINECKSRTVFKKSIYVCNICKEEFNNLMNMAVHRLFADHSNFRIPSTELLVQSENQMQLSIEPNVSDMMMPIPTLESNDIFIGNVTLTEVSRNDDAIKISDLFDLIKNKCLSNTECSTSYVCLYCTEKYLLECELLKHLFKKHLDYVGVCKTCKRKFLDKTTLKAHSMNFHNRKQLCSINYCNSIHNSFKALKTHKTKIHIGFVNKAHYYRNIKFTHLVECGICTKYFHSRNYGNHLLLHHNNDADFYKCPVCSTVRHLSSLKDHLLNHHSTTLLRFS